MPGARGHSCPHIRQGSHLRGPAGQAPGCPAAAAAGTRDFRGERPGRGPAGTEAGAAGPAKGGPGRRPGPQEAVCPVQPDGDDGGQGAGRGGLPAHTPFPWEAAGVQHCGTLQWIQLPSATADHK